MMQGLFIITSVGFFLWIIRNTLFWVELWQSKEYRVDRLSVHLRETIQGKQLFFSPVSIGKWLLLFGYGILLFTGTSTYLYDLAIAALYVFEGSRVIYEGVQRYKFRRPVRTVKSITISLLSVFFVAILYCFPVPYPYLWFLVLDRMLILLIVVFIFLFAFPTEMYIHLRIQKAKALIGTYAYRYCKYDPFARYRYNRYFCCGNGGI